jgi:hypothetical protein
MSGMCEYHRNKLGVKAMSEKEQPADTQRRDFLRGSIAAATGIAATAAAGTSIAAVADTGAGEEPETKEGYRLTRHIADYYKSAAI